MTSLAEKITDIARPHFDFTIDNTVRRIREHSLALDRCKRYTELPRLSYLCKLLPLEWAVFAYYYSLAPKDHPNEVTAAAHLKIGRATLVKTLDSLAERGMIFFDLYARSKLKIVNIAHPDFWSRPGYRPPAAGNRTDPKVHNPRQFEYCPERMNEAREFSHLPGNHVRLPYLLFQTVMHPTAKYIYGLFCYLEINVHPTLKELASFLGCATRTVSTHIAELEDCRMIYSQSRDPENFGDHTRYYYHLTDVALWHSPKASLWYRGGENSLIARIDSNGFAEAHALILDEDLEEFRPLPDTSKLVPRHALRQESSQVRQESSQVRQESSQVRQESSQVRQDIESAVHVRQMSSQVRLESPQIRQESSQIRQEELRQESSQVRQKAPQIRQESPQVRQKAPQIRQKSFQDIEKTCSTPGALMDSEENVFAKNTYIRNTEHNNTDGKYPRAERWAPVAVSFHPRLINIAQAGSLAWNARDYKCDRALWNSAVEQIAIERDQVEAIRFVDFVKSAYYAYGREFPYTPQLMQQFLDTFRSGKSWSAILGPGYQDPEEAQSALESEIQNPSPDAQTELLIEAEFTEQEQAIRSPEPALDGYSACENEVAHAVSPKESSSDPDSQPVRIEPCKSEGSVISPSGGSAPAPSDETVPVPAALPARSSGGSQQPVRVQITHANLLDMPAAMTRPIESAKSIGVDTASEKKSTARSPRRIELEKAAAILTEGMKSQASFREGFAKLNDEKFYNMLLHMFGATRVQKLVSD